jgi:chromosome segregation ATPase
MSISDLKKDAAELAAQIMILENRLGDTLTEVTMLKEEAEASDEAYNYACDKLDAQEETIRTLEGEISYLRGLETEWEEQRQSLWDDLQTAKEENRQLKDRLARMQVA